MERKKRKWSDVHMYAHIQEVPFFQAEDHVI